MNTNTRAIVGIVGFGALVAVIVSAAAAQSKAAAQQSSGSFQPRHRYRILFTAPSGAPPTVVQSQKDLDGLFPGVFHVVDVGINGNVAYITVDYLAAVAAPYSQFTGPLGNDPNLQVTDLGATP